MATVCILAFSGALALSGCAAKYAQVPARMDLQPYGRIALVTFSAATGDTGLSAFATRRFAEQVLTSQLGIELLELSASDSVEGLLAENDAATAAKLIGREHEIPALFVGYLTVSKVKPAGRLNGSGVTVKAGVTTELSVRLLSTRTGGTLWRSSASATGQLGRVDLSAGMPSIAVRDPERTHGELIRSVVARVTHDFRPTWVKQ